MASAISLSKNNDLQPVPFDQNLIFISACSFCKTPFKLSANRLAMKEDSLTHSDNLHFTYAAIARVIYLIFLILLT